MIITIRQPPMFARGEFSFRKYSARSPRLSGVLTAHPACIGAD